LNNFRLRSRISLEWMEISEIGKHVINYDPTPRLTKKIGELWSTDKKVIGAHVDPPKINTASDL